MNEHYLVFIKFPNGDYLNSLHFSYPELIDYLDNLEIEFFELVDFREFFDKINFLKPQKHYQPVNNEFIDFITVTKVL